MSRRQSSPDEEEVVVEGTLLYDRQGNSVTVSDPVELTQLRMLGYSETKPTPSEVVEEPAPAPPAPLSGAVEPPKP